MAPSPSMAPAPLLQAPPTSFAECCYASTSGYSTDSGLAKRTLALKTSQRRNSAPYQTSSLLIPSYRAHSLKRLLDEFHRGFPTTEIILSQEKTIQKLNELAGSLREQLLECRSINGSTNNTLSRLTENIIELERQNILED